MSGKELELWKPAIQFWCCWLMKLNVNARGHITCYVPFKNINDICMIKYSLTRWVYVQKGNMAMILKKAKTENKIWHACALYLSKCTSLAITKGPVVQAKL